MRSDRVSTRDGSKQGGKPLVGIIMGSDTDLPVMSESAKMLEKFGVRYEIEVTSAHRSPARTHEYASTAVSRGLKVVIVAAGGAAHLAGVVAAMTTLPVIAVPMATTVLSGIDALLSSVQMPAGVPVAAMAIDKPAQSTRRFLRRKFWPRPTPKWPSGLPRTRKSLRDQWRKKARA